MKKIFTSLLGLALCATVNAQSLRILSPGLGTPGIDEPQLMGLSISPDGRYVCGSIEMGTGYFVADIVNNTYSIEVSEDPEGAELRHVDNNGVAIGFNGPGVTYSIDGVETVLKVPSEDYKYILGEAISNDGSVMVGSLVAKGYATDAAYCKDGGDWKLLPQGTEEQLGEYAGEGSAAKYISGDGKVILGYVGSFGPAVLWIMNDEGEYELDPLFTRYTILNDEDMAAGEKQLLGLTATALSNNGKYAAFLGILLDGEDIRYVPVVYDIENQSLKIYSEPQEIDIYGTGLMPSAIADDGTFVGIIGDQPLFRCAGSFIWKAGEADAENLYEAYPCYGEAFVISDSMGYCVPTGISADGRYIMGYGYYCEDFYDDEAIPYFATYVIDTEITTGIEKPATATNATPEAFYTIDGKRLDRMAKGLNIVRMSDGTVRKVMNK